MDGTSEILEKLRRIDERLAKLEGGEPETAEQTPEPDDEVRLTETVVAEVYGGEEDEPLAEQANGVPYWLPEYRHPTGELGGIVVDEQVARATPCTSYKIGEKSSLVFSKGIVGALAPGQKETYCPTTIEKEAPPALREHLQRAKEGIEYCKVQIAGLPEGQKLDAWLRCIETQWKERGLK